ncbi:cytochrome b [Solimonas sp. SE-A11]|uniref:cytochrome b n=1 Tax=Solimonas sp. SE-A11 TaxID=3054954 RepID=UPI00259CE53C|nr:cytochrome b [Solimonas sp. SE-A11]MDM4773042.1 cytochrome b [Solimonas sp. SE-A11]
MNWRTDSLRYGSLSVAMHWLMLLLIVATYACIEFRELYEKGSEPREALKSWHFMLGLTVFALVWLRLLLRLGETTPAIQPPPPRWQLALGRAMHVALYLLMIGMPLGGWVVLSASGKPVPFFGLELPALVGENKELAKSVKEIHETVGELGYWLIGLHAAAALLHHYLLGDNTLQRMLPRGLQGVFRPKRP